MMYAQTIDPKIAEIKYKIEQLKAQINNLWSDVREYDAELRQICGCRNGQALTWSTLDGNGGGSISAPTYCGYHKPGMMSESRA